MPEEDFLNLSDHDSLLVNKYYEMWLDGMSSIDIQKSLSITEAHMKNLEPYLLAYCRHHLAHETRKDLVCGFVRDRAKLTSERKAELFKYIGAGGDVAKALRVMGIPLATYTEVWCKQDPDLKAECEMLVDKWDLDTIAALHQRALGEERPYKIRTKSRGTAVGKDGVPVPVENESVTEGTKVVFPDFNSLRFELINRMPDKYTLDGAGNGSGSRGRILAALDKIILDETDSEQEAQFDAANEERHNNK